MIPGSLCLISPVPLDFAHVPFPSADFNLYPFAVINHSHECNSFSQLASPSESSSLRVVLGIPDAGIMNCSGHAEFKVSEASKFMCPVGNWKYGFGNQQRGLG